MMEPSCLGFVFGAELSFSRAARGRSRCFWLVASRKAGGWRLRLTPVRRPVVSVSYFGTAGENVQGSDQTRFPLPSSFPQRFKERMTVR